MPNKFVWCTISFHVTWQVVARTHGRKSCERKCLRWDFCKPKWNGFYKTQSQVRLTSRNREHNNSFSLEKLWCHDVLPHERTDFFCRSNTTACFDHNIWNFVSFFQARLMFRMNFTWRRVTSHDWTGLKRLSWQSVEREDVWLNLSGACWLAWKHATAHVVF